MSEKKSDGDSVIRRDSEESATPSSRQRLSQRESLPRDKNPSSFDSGRQFSETHGIVEKPDDVEPKIPPVNTGQSLTDGVESNQRAPSYSRDSRKDSEHRHSGGSEEGKAAMEARRSKRQMSRVMTDLQYDVKVREDQGTEYSGRVDELDEKVTARDILIHSSTIEDNDKTRSVEEERSKFKRKSLIFAKPRQSARDSTTPERKLPPGAVKLNGHKVWVPKTINPLQIQLEKYMTKDLKEAFDLLENLETGTVVVDAIPTIVRACGSEPKQGEIEAILDKIKLRTSGQLELEEFFEIITTKLDQEDTFDEIERAFRLMNISKSGRISIDDLKQVSQIVGYHLDDEELQLMINETNPTPEGEATLQGFVKLMRRKQWFDVESKEPPRKPHRQALATQRFRPSYRLLGKNSK